MAQSVRCSFCTRGDLNSVPMTPMQKLVMVAYLEPQPRGGADREELPEAHWPASRPYTMSSRPMRELVSKKQGKQRASEEQHPRLISNMLLLLMSRQKNGNTAKVIVCFIKKLNKNNNP